jgi:hypothetical protein
VGVHCDVGGQSEVDAAVGTAVDHFGGVDILRNNAPGLIDTENAIAELPPDGFEAGFIHRRDTSSERWLPARLATHCASRYLCGKSRCHHRGTGVVGRETGAGVTGAAVLAGGISVATVSGTVGGSAAGGAAVPPSGAGDGVVEIDGDVLAVTPEIVFGWVESYDTAMTTIASTTTPMAPTQPAAIAAMFR